MRINDKAIASWENVSGTRENQHATGLTAGSVSADTLNASHEGDGLFEYWRILNRRRRAWLGFAVTGALLGLAVTLPRTPMFRATTTVEIVSLNQNFLNLKLTTPFTNEAGTPADNISEIQTQIKLLESPSLKKRVVERLKESGVQARRPPLHLSWIFNLLHETESKSGTGGESFEQVAKTATAVPSGQTRIIDINVDSTDPRVAAEFADTLASEFIQQNLESHWKTAETTSRWLGKQLEDMRIRLERSQHALQLYAEKNGLLITGDRGSIAEARLRELQHDLSATQADRIAKESQNELAQVSPPAELPELLNDPALRDLRAKVADARRQVAELGSVYTPEYSKLARAQAQLAALQSALDHGQADVLNSLQRQTDEADRREQLLTQAFNSQTARVAKDGENLIQYDILKREVDSNQQLYETMLGRLKESTIAATMRASNVRIVDNAKIPEYPFKPRILQALVLGLVAGLFAGAAYLVIRAHGSDKIEEPGQSCLLLQSNELGVIPTAFRRQFMPGRLLPAPDTTVSNDPIALRGPEASFMLESFRSTLISILLSTEAGPRSKVFVVTSPGPGEGKSTVATYLALAAADLGKKVLLIDADLRRPSLHQLLNVPNDTGLATLLLTMAALNSDKSLGGSIRSFQNANFYALTSGPATSSATKLLYMSYTKHLLDYLRKEFDLILVDTPPALHIPDARVIGRVADRVIVVVRAGYTTVQAARSTYSQLAADGSQILGTILNDWGPASDLHNRSWTKYYDKALHRKD